MAQNLKACAVQIRDANGTVQGTGFIVDANAVVTCAHVIEAAGAAPGESVAIAFAMSGDTCPAEVLAEAWRPADGDDIAILRLQGELPSGAIPAILGPSDGAQRHSFEAFGYPEVGDMQGVWAAGKILGPITDSQDMRMLQLESQQVAQGMSGGPVLDTRDDRVVGMITATYHPDETLKFRDAAFATPAEIIAQVLPSVKLIPPPSVWERMRQFPAAAQMLAASSALIGLLLVAALILKLPRDIQDARQPGGVFHPFWPAPSATPTPILPMPDTGFNIAVAQFTTLDDPLERLVTPASQDLSEWLYGVIDQEAQRFRDSSLGSLSFEVRGPNQIGPIPGDDPDTRAANAAQVARRHNATLLIYGVVTAGDEGYYVQPEFYVSEGGFSYASEIIGPNCLGQPVLFDPPLGAPGTLHGVNKKLDARAKALRHLVKGLAHFYVTEYDDAYVEFEEATRVPDWQPEEGQEVAYLLMGAAKLRIYDEPRKGSSEPNVLKADLERRGRALVEASEAFTQAYRLNPSYARSYLGLGTVALQQATILDSEWNKIVDVNSARLIEAERWYSNSLNAPDQPESAYVHVKAAYGLGQIHLVGYEFDLDGWSEEKARHFLSQVVSAYDPEKAPELNWLVGDAHALFCRLEAREGDWEAASSECRQAVDILSSIPYDSKRLRTQLADLWVWVAWAEKKLNRSNEALWAYGKARQVGEIYISPQLAEWQAVLECLEKGDLCRDP